MTFVDTNVVVQFLTADDPDQHARATALLGAGDVTIPLTVMLETEWVLRSNYRLARADVLAALRRLLGLPGVAAEFADWVARALDLAEARLDVADAFHLAAVPEGGTLVTFDRALIRRARALGLDAREP